MLFGPLAFMVGEGRGATADSDTCPQCGTNHKVERELLRRSRKRRRIIIVVAIIALIAILIARPTIAQLSLTPAQRMLVSADDMEPGWSSTTPRSMNDRIPEATDSATVQLGFENGSSYIDGRCTLVIYSTRELADAAYQLGLEDIQYGDPEDITMGDRAAYIQDIQNDGHAMHQLMMMQKGEYIAWFSLAIHNDQPGTADMAPLIALSEAQLKKLP